MFGGGPTRYREGGTRGGQALFSWDSIKDDKHRSYYLGATAKFGGEAWYLGSGSAADADEARRQEELAAVRAADAALAREALGLPEELETLRSANRTAVEGDPDDVSAALAATGQGGRPVTGAAAPGRRKVSMRSSPLLVALGLAAAALAGIPDRRALPRFRGSGHKRPWAEQPPYEKMKNQIKTREVNTAREVRWEFDDQERPTRRVDSLLPAHNAILAHPPGAPGGDIAGLGYSLFRDELVHSVFDLGCVGDTEAFKPDGERDWQCEFVTHNVLGDISLSPALVLREEAVNGGSTSATLVESDQDEAAMASRALGISGGMGIFKGALSADSSSSSSSSVSSSQSKLIAERQVLVYKVLPKLHDTHTVCKQGGGCEEVLDAWNLDPSFMSAVLSLPVPEDPSQMSEEQQQAYKLFINHFGTHVVSSVDVGGKLTQVTTIDASKLSATQKQERSFAASASIEKSGSPDIGSTVTHTVTTVTDHGEEEHKETLEPPEANPVESAAMLAARAAQAVATSGASEMIPDVSLSVGRSSGSQSSSKQSRNSETMTYTFEGCDPTVAQPSTVQDWVASCRTNPTTVGMQLSSLGPAMVFGFECCAGCNDGADGSDGQGGNREEEDGNPGRHVPMDNEEQSDEDGEEQSDADSEDQNDEDGDGHGSFAQLGATSARAGHRAHASAHARARARAQTSYLPKYACSEDGKLLADAVKRRKAFEATVVSMQETASMLLVATAELANVNALIESEGLTLEMCREQKRAAKAVNNLKLQINPSASPSELVFVPGSCSLELELFNLMGRARGIGSAGGGGGGDGSSGGIQASGNSRSVDVASAVSLTTGMATMSNGARDVVTRAPACQFCSIALTNHHLENQFGCGRDGDGLDQASRASCSRFMDVYGKTPDQFKADHPDTALHFFEWQRMARLHAVKDAGCAVGSHAHTKCPVEYACRYAMFCNAYELESEASSSAHTAATATIKLLGDADISLPAGRLQTSPFGSSAPDDKGGVAIGIPVRAVAKHMRPSDGGVESCSDHLMSKSARDAFVSEAKGTSFVMDFLGGQSFSGAENEYSGIERPPAELVMIDSRLDGDWYSFPTDCGATSEVQMPTFLGANTNKWRFALAGNRGPFHQYALKTGNDGSGICFMAAYADSKVISGEVQELSKQAKVTGMADVFQRIADKKLFGKANYGKEKVFCG
ncbi:hypothetical protein FNF27_06009 [Cafeteria roenbergensis]|uniref:MACPF domain-containing protein n=1 Tax=Cafeteria roenbergensis TaxID=33653 RepID=A0A5A8E428_CAFRO|nr:hypothetical protein FNF27_06009 [Cafeteria roenbergensis]